jgi:hypothetical protein
MRKASKLIQQIIVKKVFVVIQYRKYIIFGCQSCLNQKLTKDSDSLGGFVKL